MPTSTAQHTFAPYEQDVRERKRRPAHERKRRRRSLVFVTMTLGSFVLALSASSIAHQEKPRAPKVDTGTLVWGGRLFSSPADLSGWLVSRGVEYDTWALRHPRAAEAQANPLPYDALPGAGQERRNALWPYLGLFGALTLMLVVVMRTGAPRGWYVVASGAACACGIFVGQLI